MSEIIELIKNKDTEIKKIDELIKKTKDTKTIEELISKKNDLINEKLKLTNILIEFQTISNIKINHIIKPNKRKISDEENELKEIKSETHVGYLKNVNGETKKLNKNISSIESEESDNIVEKNHNINNDNLDIDMDIDKDEILGSEHKGDNKIIKIRKKKEKKINKNNIFKKIEENKVIDKLDIGTNFDFSKYNVKYTWEDKDFITEYIKKKESTLISNYIL